MAPIYNALNYDNLHLMNDDERATFNYLYAKEGESAAKEYLEYLQYELNRRSSEFWNDGAADLTKKNAFTQVVGSLLSTAIALTGGKGLLDATWQNARNAVSGDYKPIDYNRDAMIFSKTSGTIRGTVAQDIADATGVIHLDEEKHPTLSRLLNGKSLADVYQFGMGVQDSAAVAALTVINPVLGKVGSVLLSGSAATQTMLDAVERGASDDQALAMGMISGCVEMLFEKFELNSLLKADNNLLKNMGNKILSDTFGESASEIYDLAADYLIMARNSNYEQSIQRYLAEHPSWSYEQATEQALIDAVVQIVGAGVEGAISGRISSLIENKTKKH